MSQKKKNKKVLASPIDKLATRTFFLSGYLEDVREDVIRPFQDPAFVVLLMFGFFSAISIMFFHPDPRVVNDIQTYTFIIIIGLIFFYFTDVKTQPITKQTVVAVVSALGLILLRLVLIGSVLFQMQVANDIILGIGFLGLIMLILLLFELARRIKHTGIQVSIYSFAVFLFLASLFFQPLVLFTAWGGIQIIIAVAEEIIRYMIAVFPVIMASLQGEKQKELMERMWVWRYLFLANIVWVLMHYLERPISLIWEFPQYFIWLLISGVVLGYIMRNYGLGSAMLCHLLVNTIIL